MNNLPDVLEEIKALPHWVCFQFAERKGSTKKSKVPKNPATGYGAKADDPQTWATYDRATAAAQSYGFDGVGFEFGKTGSPGRYVGIDLDNCIDADGRVSNLAAEICRTIGSYTELSPSKTGLHIIARGDDLPAIGSRNDEIGLEIYNNGRFFTITGDAVRVGQSGRLARTKQAAEIREASAAVMMVFNTYLKKEEKPQPAAPAQSHTTTESDQDIIKKMLRSNKGAEIRALWGGDLSGNDNDHSRADLALINHLAYWTNGDPAAMDRLFRQSGLMRDKWDEKRGAQTYGEKTINEALRNFTPYQRPERQPAQKDFSEDPKESSFEISTASNYLSAGQYDNDIEYFKKYKDRKTGFAELDKYLTLYPGLCALGGASSLGKTTFAVNLTDRLLKRGETVLFFSLEQLPIELMTKSLARMLVERQPTTHLTNIDIKEGAYSDTLLQVKKDYAELSKNYYIVTGNFRMTAKDICDRVESFIAEKKVKPIVVIDYLQLIAPPVGFRGTIREYTDENIKTLKDMQKRNELFVLMISSFNRSSNNEPVNYEAFKETSMIEYTCDFVLGLQLSILDPSNRKFYSKKGPKGGETSTTLDEKDRMIDEAINAYPKKVQLVSLKNRNGRQRFRVDFNYYMKHDQYLEVSDFESYDDGTPYTGLDSLRKKRV